MEEELINKIKKIKKGEKIKIDGKEYVVQDFKKDFTYNEKTGEKEGIKEILLKKDDDNQKGFLKNKYRIRFNEKTKELEMYKGFEEKEISPGKIKFKSKKMFFYRG